MALTQLPDDLPVPLDDGGADHLTGLKLPPVALTATNGETVALDAIDGTCVIYIYPMTGRPDVELPDGWEQIPGARGCTPQSCSFRDQYAELQALGADLFGLSCQSSAYQNEAKARLHLPFELLSDEGLALKAALNLPTMMVEQMELYKRLTLVMRDGVIMKTFYPVFPPDKNADDVIAYLSDCMR